MSRKQKKALLRIILAAVALAIVWVLPLEGVWEVCSYLLPYLLVGWDVLWSAGRNILQGQVFDEQFLMSIATVGAFALGEYAEGVAVMLFYQLGELFQSIAVGRSRKSIAALMDIRPETATVLRNAEELTVGVEEVLSGETVIVRPGEKIPLDGILIKGETSVNTAALTGESLPRDLTLGDTVLSGSINLTGLIQLQTTGVFEESTVAKILSLIENAADRKSHAENFITKFARYYTPCVVFGALLLGLIPPILDGNWTDWIRRALIFLVVSCPCALVISVPLSFFGGIGGASKKGILMKGAEYIETLAKLRTMVFDKTGTLTKGSFAVVSVCPVGISADTLLELAATAESASIHPIAVSIVNAWGKSVDKARVSAVNEYSGLGVEAQIDGKSVFVGNDKLMRQADASCAAPEFCGTVVHVCEGSNYRGYLLIADEVKENAAQTVSDLHRLGIKKTVMLTGDRKEIAQEVAKRLGITEFYAQLLPVQKVTQVERLLSTQTPVGFVGDGINDAPVLMRADLGIAMGAFGSDAAIEAADIVLMDDNLNKLSIAVRIARKTMRIVCQNIVFALAVKLIILGLSAFGFLNLHGMWVAIFADVGVMVLAVFNAMRTFCVKP